MSRFIVTNGSSFTPFTYDELIKPVQDSAQAHAAASDAYDQLSMETEALGRYISENEDDNEARALYTNYVDQLGKLQNELWENGYNASARRGLSSARATYARDITRLQSAIKTRQERSKEYWDARHKDPSLVSGFDPALSGLDNYLNNSEYGRDWFSYSGTQFANEVGAEAKARAAEFLQTDVARNPALQGYLEYYQKNGFTNSQVNNAGLLAQAVLSGTAQLDDPNNDPIENLLAGVLLERMQATGAMPGRNLSADEFGRMFNYGMLGLSQGIGELSAKPITDNVWQEASEKRVAQYKHNLENTAPVDNSGGNYAIEGVSAYTQNPDFAEQNALYSKNVHDYNSHGPLVVNINGTNVPITSEAQAEQIFDAMGRTDIMEQFGVDPELSFNSRGKKNRVETTFRTPDGKDVTVRYVKMNGDQKKHFANDGWMSDEDGFDYTPIAAEQYVGGKWVMDERLTRQFNMRNRPYQRQREQLIQDNKGNKEFNINKIALVGKAKKNFYKEANIPSYVPTYFAEAVHDTMNRQGDVTNSSIADSRMPDALKLYSGIMQEYYSRGVALHGDKDISKTSSFAFYPINEGGIGFSPKGETNPAVVFGTKGTGKSEVPNYDGIIAVGVTPENIYDDNKIQVTTATNKTYGVWPEYLGNSVKTLTDQLRAPLPIDEKGIIHYLMLPISDPVRVSVMTPEEQQQWFNIASSNEWLGQYMRFVVDDQQNNRQIPIGPQQILMNDRLQNLLRSKVGELLNTAYSRPRDWALQHPMQVVGTTSSKAQPYTNR